MSTPEPDPGPDVSTPEPDPPPTQGTINANGGLRVRSGPGQEHSVQATVPNGSTVSILGEENGWYQIQYNGNSTGYVLKDYVHRRDLHTRFTAQYHHNSHYAQHTQHHTSQQLCDRWDKGHHYRSGHRLKHPFRPGQGV